MRPESMESESKAICPELRALSDYIDITEEGKEQLHKHGRLSLFESRFLPSGEGRIAFVGGPVSAMDFHPWAKGICAIAANRKDQQTHKILKCYQGSAHIQLWRFSEDTTACIGVIKHNGEYTCDLKWRPDESDQDGKSGWDGTVAAALGDGTVLVCYIDSFAQIPLTAEEAPTKRLAPRSTLLRLNKNIASRSPVRVVEWSKDGNLLVVGVADGSIEVYDATSVERTWPKWSIPGHESVVMDLRWLSETHLCSLGLSCVLRLRDIRDPVSTLEQNMEGLSGSLSMDTPEPNVAVVGGDYGYLRVVRLSGADGVLSRQPVKRVRLQSGSFRDMCSIPVSGHNERACSQTLFYTGGADGLLHECKFPRPIWASADNCDIDKTQIAEKLRWKQTRDEKEWDEETRTLQLQLGRTLVTYTPDAKKQGSENGDAASEPDGDGVKEELGALRVDNPSEESTKPSAARKPPSRRLRALGRDVAGDAYSLFGARYKPAVVITRVALSAVSDMLAVGICGGIVTWMQLSLHEHAMCANYLSDGAPPAAEGDKVIKPPRKRGRPREFPLLPIQPPGEPTTDIRDPPSIPPKPVTQEKEKPTTDARDMPSILPQRLKQGRDKPATDARDVPPIVPEPMKQEKEKRPRGRPRSTPVVFGPKRKRGRPRKVAGETEESEMTTKKRQRRTENTHAHMEAAHNVDEDLHAAKADIADDAVLVVKDIETSGGGRTGLPNDAHKGVGDTDAMMQDEQEGIVIEIKPAVQKSPRSGRIARRRRGWRKGKESDTEPARGVEGVAVSGKARATASRQRRGEAAEDRGGAAVAATARAKEILQEVANVKETRDKRGKERTEAKKQRDAAKVEKKVTSKLEMRTPPARRSPRMHRGTVGDAGGKPDEESGTGAKAKSKGTKAVAERKGGVSGKGGRGGRQNRREEALPKREDGANWPPASTRRGSTPAQFVDPIRPSSPAKADDNIVATMEIAHPAPPSHWQEVVATPSPPAATKMTKTAGAPVLDPATKIATEKPLIQEHPAPIEVDEITAAPPGPPAKVTTPPADADAKHATLSPPEAKAANPVRASRKRPRAELESAPEPAAEDASASAPVTREHDDMTGDSPTQKRLRNEAAETKPETLHTSSRPLCPCRLRIAPPREPVVLRLRLRPSEPVPAATEAGPRRSARTRARRVPGQEVATPPAPRQGRAPRKRSIRLRLRISEPVALTDDSDLDEEPPKSVVVQLRLRPRGLDDIQETAQGDGRAQEQVDDGVVGVGDATETVAPEAGERAAQERAAHDGDKDELAVPKIEVSEALEVGKRQDADEKKGGDDSISVGAREKGKDGDSIAKQKKDGADEAPVESIDAVDAPVNQDEDRPLEVVVAVAEKDTQPVKDGAKSVPEASEKETAESAAALLLNFGAKDNTGTRPAMEASGTEIPVRDDIATVPAEAAEVPSPPKARVPGTGAKQSGDSSDVGRPRSKRTRKPSWKVA